MEKHEGPLRVVPLEYQRPRRPSPWFKPAVQAAIGSGALAGILLVLALRDGDGELLALAFMLAATAGAMVVRARMRAGDAPAEPPDD